MASESAKLSKPSSPSPNRATKRVPDLATAPPIVHDVLRRPGLPLDAQTRNAVGARFDFNFSDVRVHSDAQAAQSARAVDAAAYTVGHNIVFDAGEFQPHSPRGQDLLRHELMHVRQQRSAVSSGGALAIGDVHSPLERDAGAVAPRLMLQRGPKKPPEETGLPTSLDQLPEAERKKITVFEQLPTNINEVIGTTWDPDKAAGYVTDADTKIVYGSGIADADKKPLDSLSNYLVGDAPVHMGLDQTVTIDIAPMKQRVRFTYAGVSKGKIKKVILVEGLGPAPAAPAAKDGEARFQAKKCTFATDWSDSDKQLLFQALAMLPDSAIPEGLTFKRAALPKAKKTDQPKRGEIDPKAEAALYDPDSNTMTVFNAAFAGGSAPGVYFSLLHEMGHAFDFGPVREATKVYQASGKTAADETKLKQAQQLSGGDMDPDDYGTEFRKAAHKDGVVPDTSTPPRITLAGTEATLKGSPTDYGNTNWKEFFAEAFAMFMTDPQLLHAIRPNIYAYFLSKFPASASAPAKATPQK